MSAFEFRDAWKRNDETLKREAQAFWTHLGVLEAKEFEERADQLCALAYDDGRLASVSTAQLTIVPRLQSRFAYMRSYVDPQFRRRGVATAMWLHCFKMISDWSLANPQEKIMGLFVIVQAPEVRHRIRIPVVKGFGPDFILIGYTPKNDQMRVAWFDHATVE